VKPNRVAEDETDVRAQYGVGVPNGEVARTPDEAEAVAKNIGIFHANPVYCDRN
jgi:hypothetical protein